MIRSTLLAVFLFSQAAWAQEVKEDDGLIVITTEIRKDEKQRQELVEQVKTLPPQKQQEVTEQVRLADAYRAQADAELAKAKTEKNEAVRQVHMREALDKAELARRIQRRAEEVIFPTLATEPAYVGAAPKGANIGGDGTAMGQLRKSSALGESNVGRSGFGESSGKSTDATAYDPRRGTLMTSGGHTVNVFPVIDKVQRATGGAVPPEKVFERTSQPDGSTVYRLSPPARDVINKQQRQPPTGAPVGGVDLRTTLDLLAFAGLPDFRHNAPLRTIDRPVLVSLTQLSQAVGPRLKRPEDWRALPDELRFPGGIERVFGFTRSADGSDIILIGAAARHKRDRISLDLIAVALDSVWRRNQVPRVSLDPPPDGARGPQVARVEGVPRQSAFARILLDADYAMKKIAFGMVDIGVTPFAENLKAQLAMMAQLQIGYASRWWLEPKPLAPASVHRSATGRTTMYAPGLAVQVEQEAVKGTVSPADLSAIRNTDDHMAEAFSGALESLANHPNIEPPGIYARMLGVNDLTIAAWLLRRMRIDTPALSALADLPLPLLAESVPATFPEVVYDVPGYPIRARGGAVMMAGAASGVADWYQDAVTASIERAVDGWPRNQGLSLALDRPLTVPDPQSLGLNARQEAIRRAQFLASTQEWGAALKIVDAALRDDPFDEYLLVTRGRLLLELGQDRDGIFALERAIALHRGNPTMQELVLRNILYYKTKPDISIYDDAVRREVSAIKSGAAKQLFRKRKFDLSRGLVDEALYIWPANRDALLLRALGRDDPLDQEATALRAEAIKVFRRDYATRPNDETAFALGWALAIDASSWLRALAEDTEADETIRRKAIEGIRAQIGEANKLVPDMPPAMVVTLQVNMAELILNQQAGRPADPASLLFLVSRFVPKFPDYAPLRVAEAQAALLVGRSDVAVDVINQAVALDPDNAQALFLRAGMASRMGQCPMAKADLKRARELNGRDNPALSKEVTLYCG
ncbi:MAG: DUF1598 domain-containing protein [Alphaproteobacteria bacterium]